jgi:putative peptidoglycan lipid II flippase
MRKMSTGETELAAVRVAAPVGGLARAASIIAVGTVASRALGLLRDVIIAAFFGATSVKSAFVIAYSLPFFAQRLFLGGVLSVVFIPAVVTLLMQGDEEETRRVITSTFNLVLLIGCAMVVGGVVAAPVLVRIAAPGYLRTNPQVLTTAVGLTRVMFLAMVFLALSAFATGFLNAHRQFAVPALAPLIFNVVIIGAVLLLGRRMGILGVAVSFLLGWVAQFLVQIPAARRAGLHFGIRLDVSHPAIREMGRLAVPAMLGLAVIEINSNVGRFFASFLPARPGVDYIAVLDYAFQLIQAPTSVFALSLATALFPTMARHAAGGGPDALRATTSLGLRGVLFTMMPVMAGTLALSHLIVQVIFQRGVFASPATDAVALGLIGYTVGTVPYAAYYIVTRTYYALHDTRTPVRIGAYMIVLNAIGDAVLMRWLGHTGIALATSLVAIANVGWLLWLLRPRLGGLDGPEVLRTAARTAVASALLAAAALGTTRILGSFIDSTHFAGAAIEVVLALGVGGIVYLGVCALLGVRELALLGALRRSSRA